MLSAVRQLRAAGVLGLNERNSDFIMRLNPRCLYPRVDDKALTKELALEAGMAVPDLYGIIANQGEVRTFGSIVENLESFVIKPAQGSGGDGILVVTGAQFAQAQQLPAVERRARVRGRDSLPPAEHRWWSVQPERQPGQGAN